MYSREMAQGGTACCPNGCGKGQVRRLQIERLLELEDKTIICLENAQYDLQSSVVISSKNDDFLGYDMMM